MPVSCPPALELSINLLRCPLCRTSLRFDSGALRCLSNHTFNIARQGYVSLLTGERATSGDEGTMVQARERFLATGGYTPIRHAVTHLAGNAFPGQGRVLDVGCGTGYYLADVLDRLPGAVGLGLDTSVRALRSAARAHVRAAAATWDVFRPFPLVNAAVDVVLDVFAPRNPAEFHRVLRPGGRLIVARPTERHLAELRSQVPSMVTVDPTKEQRLHQALDPFFEVLVTEQVEYPLSLSTLNVPDLIGMTPSARHIDSAELSKHDFDSDQEITVSVLVTAYRAK